MNKFKILNALVLLALVTLFTACKKSNDLSVDDLSVSGTSNGHDYVDLGLSVKWGTCNVGAAKPSGYGDYFAWGEIAPKSTYDWITYEWGNTDALAFTTITKYSTDDNKTTLELSDDAAHANFGGQWRMPTKEEWNELSEKCTWVWIEIDGVQGYRVSRNGNSIFLPAAGYHNTYNHENADCKGWYWSSSFSDINPPVDAYDFVFCSSTYRWYSHYRCYGYSVRPVLP